MRKLWLLGFVCLAPTLSAQVPLREYKTVMSDKTLNDVHNLFMINGIFAKKVTGLEISVFLSNDPVDHVAYGTGRLTIKCNGRDISVMFFIPREARSAPWNESDLIHKGLHPTTLIRAFTILNTDAGDKLLHPAVGSALSVLPLICNGPAGNKYFSLSLWVDDAELKAQAGLEALSVEHYNELIASAH